MQKSTTAAARQPLNAANVEARPLYGSFFKAASKSASFLVTNAW